MAHGDTQVNPTGLPRSRAKARLQSRDKREAVSLENLKAEAVRCHTPRQFSELLENLRTVIPYEKFAGIWGHPAETIRFMPPASPAKKGCSATWRIQFP